MEAFLTSAVLVALAEIGDKTQLLSFVLAARLRKPGAIILGIFVATLLNHALAGSVGVWLASLISPQALPWITGLLFVGFGLWTLHPDSLDDDPKLHRAGATLLGIVDDILDFSKLEAGAVEIEHIPFDLEELVEHVATIDQLVAAKEQEVMAV